ncbi:MAG: hypothetical protein BRD39_01970 [Bacteroidetes bacterium QH_9_64_21]|nr:MAG: hypothetical protein BRD39_01970 [Bacteroidetes bacterium QH_9_64_21]
MHVDHCVSTSDPSTKQVLEALIDPQVFPPLSFTSLSISVSASSPSDILTVTELTRGLSNLVEEHYDDLWVEGELSDFTRAASGHCYFTLKDEDAQIRCVMWKHLTQYVYFEPEEGMQVRVNGHASVYERRGDLQIQAQALRKAGKGARQKAFEQLKQKLRSEGLFDAERKKRLDSPRPRWCCAR